MVCILELFYIVFEIKSIQIILLITSYLFDSSAISQLSLVTLLNCFDP